jgi:hypothetical protein
MLCMFYCIPVNEPDDNQSTVSFVRHPMLSGIVPSRDVYCIRIDCRFLSCPMVVGRAPLILKLNTNSLDNLDIEHMVVGMEPRVYIRIYIIIMHK